MGNAVKVDVEYCGKCNFLVQCKMLENFLLQKKPEVDVSCKIGCQQGCFEVKINDTLVHSKLQTLAFPKHESILENIEMAEKGLPLKKAEEQPIDNCVMM